ncbi:MAG: type IV pilus assembly protein PilM [Planctomycetota bacterium]|jgi:type IV pilus assembly protein PilM
MAKTATGIDVGTSTVKLLRGEVQGTSFVVSDFRVAPNDDSTIAGGWRALGAGAKAKSARIGVTGREVNVRYVRVPRLPDWQLRKLMRFEAAEIGGQSDAAVASDFNVLPEIPEIDGEDVVMLCMARESLLKEHLEGITAIKGGVDAFTPNAVALYNAFLHYGVVMDDTVLLANIGRESTDVVLVRGADLIFARNLSGGSALFDEAIAQRFQIGLDRAERFKIDEASIEPGKTFSDPNREKAARAMAAPAGQLLSLLQSAVMFAKSQIKLSSLKVDRVLLSGGGAALEGLPEYLKGAMGVPVEIFDPFIVCDTSKLDQETAQLLDEHRMEAVIALGLATTASDAASYSVEILPESLRKKRDFTQGPLFLIFLAALALAYLGFFWTRKGAELETVQVQATALERDVSRKERADQATSALIAENRSLGDLADELHEIGGSGELAVRFMAAAERHLPQDFWLESLTSNWARSEELGIPNDDEQPILRIKGSTREGARTPEALFEEFVRNLRGDLPEAVQVVDRWNHLARGFELEIALHPRRPAVAASADAAEDTFEGDQ